MIWNKRGKAGANVDSSAQKSMASISHLMDLMAKDPAAIDVILPRAFRVRYHWNRV
jgi:hypothetical protein